VAVANPAAKVPAAAAVAEMSLLELREPLRLLNLEPLLMPPTMGVKTGDQEMTRIGSNGRDWQPESLRGLLFACVAATAFGRLKLSLNRW
jgi:hypothetical protein